VYIYVPLSNYFGCKVNKRVYVQCAYTVRMQDVVAYDKNRVRLARGRLSDRTYINASLIRTVCHQPAIVVTQCPSEDTVGEFWKTVWELNIGSVVMLVPCEDCSTRAPVYWPAPTHRPTVYADVEVQQSLQSRNFGCFRQSRILRLAVFQCRDFGIRKIVKILLYQLLDKQ